MSPAPPSEPEHTPSRNRWQRWFRYSLLLCALTPATCLALGALLPAIAIEMVLVLLLAPLIPIFWIERSATLNAGFQDAAQLLHAFPPRHLNPEKMLDLLRGHDADRA